MAGTADTYETTVTVRFRDLDPMGQVHNSVVLQYVEEARIRYFRDVLDTDFTEVDGAVAGQDIDYRAPITHGASVTVRYRVTEIGSSSLTMAFEVHADDALAAEGEVVHVALDESGTPAALPESWVEKVRAFEGIDGD
ncbi:thioesterase family protein [Haloarchaeobius sp. FL176]|uniref:acyl-CoA thioesterase n=1 Tax=Haloarchaeobius sp. FL176 TaxID=2967129 RepID=UPI0021489D66|nr:thioesterase family protein [Haloarchaeobius sp. FL176]